MRPFCSCPRHSYRPIGHFAGLAKVGWSRSGRSRSPQTQARTYTSQHSCSPGPRCELAHTRPLLGLIVAAWNRSAFTPPDPNETPNTSTHSHTHTNGTVTISTHARNQRHQTRARVGKCARVFMCVSVYSVSVCVPVCVCMCVSLAYFFHPRPHCCTPSPVNRINQKVCAAC